MKLKIKNEFRDLIPPLSDEEFKGLEKSLKEEGIRDAIVTWNGFIIDGHNRYTIANRWDLPFTTVDKEFSSEDDVKWWMLKNQMARRNLTDFSRAEIALQMEDIIAKKAKENQGARTDIPQNSAKSSIDTREEIAKLAGVSHDTISKVKKIKKDATPEQIKSLQIKTPKVSINSVHKDIKSKENKSKTKKVALKPDSDHPFDSKAMVKLRILVEELKVLMSQIDAEEYKKSITLIKSIK